MSEVEGGSDGNGNSDQGGQHQFTIEEKIIIAVLESFREDMEAWLEVHGKGPLSAYEMRMLEGLPGCMPEDVETVEGAVNYVDYLAENNYFKLSEITNKMTNSPEWETITGIGEGLDLAA